MERGTVDGDGQRHSAKAAWRALALLQTEIEAEKAIVVPAPTSRYPEELIAAADPDWIANGGDGPPAKGKVEVKLRDGTTNIGPAGQYRWTFSKPDCVYYHNRDITHWRPSAG